MRQILRDWSPSGCRWMTLALEICHFVLLSQETIFNEEICSSTVTAVSVDFELCPGLDQDRYRTRRGESAPRRSRFQCFHSRCQKCRSAQDFQRDPLE